MFQVSTPSHQMYQPVASISYDGLSLYGPIGLYVPVASGTNVPVTSYFWSSASVAPAPRKQNGGYTSATTSRGSIVQSSERRPDVVITLAWNQTFWPRANANAAASVPVPAAPSVASMKSM